MIGWMLAACLLAGGMSWLGTRQLERDLRRRAWLDLPNDRSSHSVPTPRGGGIAVSAVIALGLGYWRLVTGPDWEMLAVLAVFIALAGLGHLDDRHNLSARLRLGVQLGAVALLAWGIGPGGMMGAALVLGWVWMINLTNFMDGIDGISAVQAACVSLGLIGVALIVGRAPWPILVVGPVVLGAVLGFAVLNWHPARIFLGDVGSIPLGFISFYLLYDLVRAGLWLPALILPMYYVADASLTLGRRALRGEKIWQAHRGHFYQRAVTAGRSHAQVARAVLYCDAVLIACAWGAAAAAKNPRIEGASAAIAVVSVATLLYWLSRKPHLSQS